MKFFWVLRQETRGKKGCDERHYLELLFAKMTGRSFQEVKYVLYRSRA